MGQPITSHDIHKPFWSVARHGSERETTMFRFTIKSDVKIDIARCLLAIAVIIKSLH